MNFFFMEISSITLRPANSVGSKTIGYSTPVKEEQYSDKDDSLIVTAAFVLNNNFFNSLSFLAGKGTS